MKILIIGARGMLGQDLAKELSEYDLTLWDKEEVDITDQEQVEQKIVDLNPELIINSAAYTAVDDCEKNRELAMAINGQAVGYLAAVAEKLAVPIIHFSTDYVFNGRKEDGYDEDFNKFEPLNVYGESKLLGEKLLQEGCSKYYLIRISWLFGKGGSNFVQTMLKLGQERASLKVVDDQLGKPTYTVDLAGQVKYIINNQVEWGIYHATNETKPGGISWYEFAQKIFEIAGLEVELNSCNTDEFPRPATRPRF